MSSSGRLTKQTSTCLRCQYQCFLRQEIEQRQSRRTSTSRPFSTLSWRLQEAHAAANDAANVDEANAQTVTENVTQPPYAIRKFAKFEGHRIPRQTLRDISVNFERADTNLANNKSLSRANFSAEDDSSKGSTFRIRRTDTNHPPTFQRQPPKQSRGSSPVVQLYRPRNVRNTTPRSKSVGASPEEGIDLANIREKHAWKRLNLHRRDRLGVKALGEEAEIVTLDDHGRRRDRGTFYVKDQEEADQDAKQPTYGEMLDEISNARKQGKQVDRKDIDRAMVRLKAKWSKTPKDQNAETGRGDFKIIRRQIHDSFTHEQLIQYYESNTRESVLPSKDTLKKPDVAIRRFMRAIWVSEKHEKDFPTDAGAAKSRRQELKVALRGSKKKMKEYPPTKLGTSKVSLIDTILRDCWKLRPKDSAIAQGSCDVIFLDEAYMKLLLQHRLDILKQVSNAYGAKVQASLPLKYLRISGDYDTCLDAFQTISNFVLSSRLKIVDIPGKDVQRSNGPSPGDGFPEIEKHTNTVITRFVRSAKQAEVESVQVFFADGEEQNLEDAERLLLRDRLDLPLPSIECSLNGLTSDERIDMVTREMDEHFERQRKGGSWARATSALRREHILQLQENTKKLLEPVIVSQASFIDRIIADTGNQPQAWYSCQPNVHHKTSCSFGQLLCSLNTTLRSNDPHKSDPLLKSWPDRLFLSGGIGLQNILQADFLANTNRFDQLRILLVPESALRFQSRKQSESLHRVHLELLLDINRDSGFTALSRARLICDWEQSQAFLPHAGSDIAFDTQFYIPFQSRDSPSLTTVLPQSVVDFLRSSNLNVQGQDRLRTPGSLCLDLPQTLLGSLKPSPDRVSPSDSTFVGATTPIKFTFWALQHQSLISAKYKDVNFECKMVEAGKLEERWEESRLVLPEKLVSLEQETVQQALLNMAAPTSKKKVKKQTANVHVEKITERLRLLANKAADILDAVRK